MTTVDKLLRVHLVDQQIEGLQGRLRGAERFLKSQEAALEEFQTRKRSLEGQLRQLSASAHNLEGEANGIQERVDALRERMNQSKTNKEYQATLVEVNTLLADKSKLDEQAIGLLEQIEQLKAQIAELDGQIAERTRMRDGAVQDRATREDEVRDRLDALRAEREQLVREVPADALAAYEERRGRFGGEDENVMSPLVEQNVRRYEFCCGACMMTVPMDAVTALVSGRMTTCTSCGVILYLEEESAEKLAVKKR